MGNFRFTALDNLAYLTALIYGYGLGRNKWSDPLVSVSAPATRDSRLAQIDVFLKLGRAR